MNEIKFESDSAVVRITKHNDRFNISGSKLVSFSIPAENIVRVEIKKRLRPFKIDTFFILYGVFTEIVGIGALYFLFKTIGAEYFIYGAITFVVISAIYFTVIVKAANERASIFIITGKKSFEFPVNKRSELNRISTFFKENGITVFSKVQR